MGRCGAFLPCVAEDHCAAKAESFHFLYAAEGDASQGEDFVVDDAVMAGLQQFLAGEG